MNKLILRIDNLAAFENGGPVQFEVTKGSASIGRKAGMDWILPDATRHISGHHFDVSTQDGSNYWLTDCSSNGTYLEGDRMRLPGPHPIRAGDRFTVGRYIITAELIPLAAPTPHSPEPQPAATVAPELQQAPAAQSFAPLPQTEQPNPTSSGLSVPPDMSAQQDARTSDPFADIWGDTPGNDPTASYDSSQVLQAPNVQPPVAGVPTAQTASVQAADFSQLSAAPMPSDLVIPPGTSSPPVEPPSLQIEDPFAEAVPVNGETENSVPQSADPFLTSGSQAPAVHSASASPQIEPEVAPEAYWSDVGQGPISVPMQPAAPQNHSADAFVEAFFDGAGVAPPVDLKLDPMQLAFIAGQCARLGTTEMMAMLQERSAVKLFISGEDRTMRVAAGNNPMKFLPDPEQAFEAMFIKPRDGYMTGEGAFQNSLEDIRSHQAAFIAALQPALSEMIDGLAPDDIEEEIGSSSTIMSGGSKKKFWEEFVNRWEKRAAQGENGMLDVFIKAFARHYSHATRQTRL